MKTILVMSLSGSIMFLLVMLWGKITKYKYEARIYYFLLKVCLLFYLLPLADLKIIYRNIMDDLELRYLTAGLKNLEEIDSFYFTYTEGAYISKGMWLRIILVSAWLLLAIGILVYSLLQYGKAYRILKQCESEQILPEDEACIETGRTNLGLRRKVLLRPYRGEQGRNFTLGIIKPIIVYDPAVESTDKEYILHHEQAHIKHLDMLWAIVMWAVLCIHWVNPFVWILKRKFVLFREMSCDEAVLKQSDSADIRKYAMLIIDQSCKTKKVRYGLSLSPSAKACKRRVENIMKVNNKKKIGVAGILGIAGMVMLNTLTVFAYPDNEFYDLGEVECDADLSKATEVSWSFIPAEKLEDGEIYGFSYNTEVLYEYQFVDVDGNIYELSEEQFYGEVEACATCNHNYVIGQSQMHVNQPDGGCILYTYESQRCTKCGDIEGLELICEVKYIVCPH